MPPSQRGGSYHALVPDQSDQDVPNSDALTAEQRKADEVDAGSESDCAQSDAWARSMHPTGQHH